ELGKMSDVNDKIEYALGSVINLKLIGNDVKAFIEKSRYTQLQRNEFIDFNNGYEILCDKLGKQVFTKESIAETLATKEQLEEARRLIKVLSVPEEWLNKKIASCRASSVDQLSEKDMQELINLMLNRLNEKEAS
ncbi:MAG TPA: hypothetical protein VK553_10530, partial [Candidatus Nitrosopolaris rasttigaisensis]|nr:hypothetical protein [Candidatus Nitrosopolaris rasttigaisensis]